MRRRPSKLARRQRLLRWARLLWASPNTLIGLALGLLLLLVGARVRRVGGVLEIAALRRKMKSTGLGGARLATAKPTIA